MTRGEHFVLLFANLEPRVFQDLSGCRSAARILVENLCQKLFRTKRHMIWELNLFIAYARVQLFVVSAFERKFATQKCKQQNARSPYVCWSTRILDFTHDFWCHVTWRPTENLDFPFVWYASTEAKIDQFRDGLGLIEQNVLKLDISVTHVPLVTVINTLDNLLPQEFGFQLRHLPVWLHLQVSVQAASVYVLHDYEHLLMALKGFV